MKMAKIVIILSLVAAILISGCVSHAPTQQNNTTQSNEIQNAVDNAIDQQINEALNNTTDIENALGSQI